MARTIDGSRRQRPRAVLTLGQICYDLIFTGGMCGLPQLGQEVFAESLHGSLGGGAGITAVALARLGLPVGIISKVGPDHFGELLLNGLTSAGVDTAHVRVVEGVHTDLSVAISFPDDRGFLSHICANRSLDVLDVSLDYIKLGHHLHICLGNADETARWSWLIETAHLCGLTTSVDLGWSEHWHEHLPDVLASADVVFPNVQEALRLCHTRKLQRACEVLGRHGATVVIKKGPAGALAWHQGQVIEAPGYSATVVDTTGAGDVFDAGFLWAALSGYTLHQALCIANLCGARSVEQPGGLAAPPTVGELHDLATTCADTADRFPHPLNGNIFRASEQDTPLSISNTP